MGALSTKITEHNLEADVDRRARARAYYTSPKGQSALRTRRMQHWLATQEKHRTRGAAARAAQEATPPPNHGERVWVARCIAGGSLRFWAVLAGDARLEIARSADASPGAEARGEGVFAATLGPGDVAAERARIASTAAGDGDLDGYYVALVGWGAPGADCGAQLAQLAASAGAATAMSRADAQALLGKAVQGLVGRRRARDGGWVAADVEARRTRDRWLAAPPVEMLQRVLDVVFGAGAGGAGALAAREGREDGARLAVMDAQQARMHSQMQAHIQDQVQMQMQAQIQSQINASIQASALASSSSAAGAAAGSGGGGGV